MLRKLTEEEFNRYAYVNPKEHNVLACTSCFFECEYGCLLEDKREHLRIHESTGTKTVVLILGTLE